MCLSWDQSCPSRAAELEADEWAHSSPGYPRPAPLGCSLLRSLNPLLWQRQQDGARNQVPWAWCGSQAKQRCLHCQKCIMADLRREFRKAKPPRGPGMQPSWWERREVSPVCKRGPA